MTHCLYFKIPIDQMQMIILFGQTNCSSFFLNKQGPLNKQQRREAGSFVDQDQQYFSIKRKTKCKADRTAKRVILMPNISVSHY